MRLSTEIFRSHDATAAENLRIALLAATGGRGGLLSSDRPFEISVNIHNGILEVVKLQCLGITRSGRLVDISFDSGFKHSADLRISVPAEDSNETFLLVVQMMPGESREINDNFSEDSYRFCLVDENSILDDDALPVGRLVNQYGWRMDETDFVPPCLYVNAHHKYEEALVRAEDVLKSVRNKCTDAQDCLAKILVSMLWPAAANGAIILDRERQTLTPERLAEVLQRTVDAFSMGCAVDPYISLESADQFFMYGRSAHDDKRLLESIERGITLCNEINIKMDAVASLTDDPKPQPPEKTPEKKKPETGPNKRRWAGIEV